MHELIDAANQLSDTLHGIQDPGSAESSLSLLDQKYDNLCAVYKRLPEVMRNNKDAKILQSTAQELQRDTASAIERLKIEQKRLKMIRGLPTQFWKIVTTRGVEVVVSTVEFMQSVNGPFSKDVADRIYKFRDLLQKCGFEKILIVEFVNLPPGQTQVAFNRLRRLAPDATLLPGHEENTEEAILVPVPDFKALKAKIDFGTIVFEDEPQRTIRVEVDRSEMDAEQAQLRQGHRNEFSEPRDPEQKKMREEAQARMEAARKRREEERLAREKEERGPDPSDPQYYDNLVERMLSGNFSHRDKAIAALLVADPAQVPADAAKKIARGFKTLADGDNIFDRRKAIKGLVIWGGKYSVPILLRMLDADGFSNQEEILKGLAELKDPRAAKVFAARLGDFRFHQLAVSALNDMGSGAEDAVLEVAPSEDAKICIAALTVLGNIGTDKSISMLQKGQASRNTNVRTVARESMRMVNVRIREEKAKAKAKATEE